MSLRRVGDHAAIGRFTRGGGAQQKEELHAEDFHGVGAGGGGGDSSGGVDGVPGANEA